MTKLREKEDEVEKLRIEVESLKKDRVEGEKLRTQVDSLRKALNSCQKELEKAKHSVSVLF